LLLIKSLVEYGMHKDIKDYIQTCLVCQQAKNW